MGRGVERFRRGGATALGERRARPGPGRVVTTAALALICAVLPMFLLGALAPRLIADLGIDEVAIGALVAVFFLSGAVWSLPGGYVTDRIGSTAALRLGATVSAVLAVAVATLGHELWILVVLFVFAGAAVPLADTGGARAISTGVALRRQGLAFGGKEASIPVASMLAGLTVPILGAQLGWRPAYIVAAVLAAAVILAVPAGLDRPGPGMPTPPEERDDPPPVAPSAPAVAVDRPADDEVAAVDTEPLPDAVATRRALVLLAAGSGLAGAAGNSAPTFLVSSAVATGVSEASAGILLAIASVAGIASRIVAGLVADRRGGSERRIMAGLMGTGALGMAILAFGGPALTLVGAVLAFGGGWGWTGLAFFAAVRLLPHRPARAAGAILAGLASGGALGPLTFGALAAGPGYLTAWAVGAGAMLVAGTLTAFADRTVDRSTTASPDPR